ncbi:Intraflagellar transport protein 46, partial [Rhizophlyctis rosea]
MALARLIALFPQLDISILSAAIERTNSTEAAIALVKKMTHLLDDREERPQSARRERERKVTAEKSAVAEDAPKYNRPVTARTRKQLDEDEIIARELQSQMDRAPTARTKQRQVDEDELMARAEQEAEDEKIARNRSGGMNNLAPEDLNPSDPRRAKLMAEREEAQRVAAIKGSLPASKNLSANLQQEPSSELEGSEADHLTEASTDAGDIDEPYLQPLKDPDALIFPEASTGSSPSPTSVTSDDPLIMHMQELFSQIASYEPETIELQPELKCFVPDYIPSIGDIDPMIKVSIPARWPDVMDKQVKASALPSLGLIVLDEPATAQSDPAVLDLKLRALSKSHSHTTSAATHAVRSIPLSFSQHDPAARAGQKALVQWVKNTYDLHVHKPPDRVDYSRPMPDVETLMAEWPEEVERGLSQGDVSLPPPDIDLPLPDYTRLLCSILDIPVHNQPLDGKSRNPSSTARAHIEALHV